MKAILHTIYFVVVFFLIAGFIALVYFMPFLSGCIVLAVVGGIVLLLFLHITWMIAGDLAKWTEKKLLTKLKK